MKIVKKKFAGQHAVKNAFYKCHRVDIFLLISKGMPVKQINVPTYLSKN